MAISRKTVAENIEAWLERQMSREQLVDWAETALMESEFDE